jgi:hypothetical protein
MPRYARYDCPTHVRFHDLRHTSAARPLQVGIDLCVIKELLVHKSNSTYTAALPVAGRMHWCLMTTARTILSLLFTVGNSNILNTCGLSEKSCNIKVYHRWKRIGFWCPSWTSKTKTANPVKGLETWLSRQSLVF